MSLVKKIFMFVFLCLSEMNLLNYVADSNKISAFFKSAPILTKSHVDETSHN